MSIETTPDKNELPVRTTCFGDDSESKYIEAWQDKNGDIQIRVIDNADALITRITLSGGGVERLWHPGTGGDEDDVQEIGLVPEPWPRELVST